MADETQCTGEFSSYLKRTGCKNCADYWCENTFLCTNEESLCNSLALTQCEDDTPNCYPRGTVQSIYGDCICAIGFTGDSCSECEMSPTHPGMEYICCEDTSFEHGMQLLAVKRRDIANFLKGEYTNGNCTPRVINDCDCLTASVIHVENANAYLFYGAMETNNDSKSPKKVGQGIIAFSVSLVAGFALVIACVVAVYFVNRRREKETERKI